MGTPEVDHNAPWFLAASFYQLILFGLRTFDQLPRLLTLPLLALYAAVLWTSLLVFHDMRTASNSRCFLRLLSFYLYWLTHCLASGLAGAYLLGKMQALMPASSPDVLIALVVGLLGTFVGMAVLTLKFQPLESIDLDFKQFANKFRLSVINEAIRRKAAVEKRYGDELAEMIAIATDDTADLEEKYMEIVGDTVSNPTGASATVAKAKMQQYKVSSTARYAYHVARSMVSADFPASALYLKRLYWVKQDHRRFWRWFLKGIVKVNIMEMTL